MSWIVGLAERETGYLADWNARQVTVEELPFEDSELRP